MADLPVRPLFVGPEYVTQVWVSDEVRERIDKYLSRDRHSAQAYLHKVDYYAKAGFATRERSEDVRHKWDGVYAIQPYATLFRLYGFYGDNQKRCFIIVASTMKKGQKMRDKDKAEVNFTAAIRESGAWEKVE